MQGYDLSKVPDGYAVTREGLIVPHSSVQLMLETWVERPDGTRDVERKPARSLLRNWASIISRVLLPATGYGFPFTGPCLAPANVGKFEVVDIGGVVREIDTSSSFLNTQAKYCTGLPVDEQYQTRILFGTGGAVTPLTTDSYLGGCLTGPPPDANDGLNAGHYTTDFGGLFLTPATAIPGTNRPTNFYSELDVFETSNNLTAEACPPVPLGSQATSIVSCEACDTSPAYTGAGVDPYTAGLLLNEVALQLTMQGFMGSFIKFIVARDVISKTLTAQGQAYGARYDFVYNV
jgi:hypothetical protein